MWLKGADALPGFEDSIRELENRLIENAGKVKKENFATWFAWTIYNRLPEKLKSEPVEDFRIDFEDSIESCEFVSKFAETNFQKSGKLLFGTRDVENWHSKAKRATKTVALFLLI